MDRKFLHVLGLALTTGLTLAAFAGGAAAQERGRINDGQPLRIEQEPNSLNEPNPEAGGVIDVDELLGVAPARKTPEDVEREKRSTNQHPRHKEKSPEGR